MKQVTISFKENLSDSFYYSRNVSAALYIDLQQEQLQFFSDEVLRGSKRSKREIEFVSKGSKKFICLKELLDRLVQRGIGIEQFQHYKTLKAYYSVRRKEHIDDNNVHWQVFVEEDDGSWLVCVNCSLEFPPELEALYEFAKTMRDNTEEYQEK